MKKERGHRKNLQWAEYPKIPCLEKTREAGHIWLDKDNLMK